jgi:hypothetical protein
VTRKVYSSENCADAMVADGEAADALEARGYDLQRIAELERQLAVADDVIFHQWGFYPYAFPERLTLARQDALDRYQRRQEEKP